MLRKRLVLEKIVGRVHTRFPPEPNGYLHIGHAKSICLNFGTAQKYGGLTNLRFDDTNPSKEETEYVDSIMEDVHWLGFGLGTTGCFMPPIISIGFSILLLSSLRKAKHTSTTKMPRPSAPKKERQLVQVLKVRFRNRSITENLDLFMRMKSGEFDEGVRVLRAKIDMTSPNMHMRDPIIYRIMKTPHHRTGDKWCIYPMYDFAHGQW